MLVNIRKSGTKVSGCKYNEGGWVEQLVILGKKLQSQLTSKGN